MRHATECGERDVMRFVGETAGCLVEKDIELRGAVEDLDRRIEEIRLQIVMLSGKKEGRDRRTTDCSPWKRKERETMGRPW